VQTALHDATGHEWVFKVEFDGNTAAASGDSHSETVVPAKVTTRQRNEEVLQIPLIQAAVDKLGARLLKVDEGFGSGSEPATEGENSDNQEP